MSVFICVSVSVSPSVRSICLSGYLCVRVLCVVPSYRTTELLFAKSDENREALLPSASMEQSLVGGTCLAVFHVYSRTQLGEFRPVWDSRIAAVATVALSSLNRAGQANELGESHY